jgi:hypothetical protein
MNCGAINYNAGDARWLFFSIDAKGRMWMSLYREEYDRLLEEKNAAEENAIFAYQKKKGLIAEKKMVS